MEYGHFITDSAGNKTFFVEGCTNCSMLTGGLHESNCPCNKEEVGESLNRWEMINPEWEEQSRAAMMYTV